MENNLYKKSWDAAMMYSDYRNMVDALLLDGKTTGPDQSESMVSYAAMNQQRMQRIEKNYHPSDEVVAPLKPKADEQLWLVITEGWCGDASQSLPVMAALADKAGIDMRVVLRDEHLELMDKHLTNGGRSIPVLLVLKRDDFGVLGAWGPRPEVLQLMVKEYKSAPEPKVPYSEFLKEVHLWYARDKQQAVQNELMEVVLTAKD